MPFSTLTSKRSADEQGFAMILVIGLTMVLMILSGVVVTLASQANTNGQQHQKFDQAIDAAEAGIDQVLGRLTADRAYTAGSAVPVGGFPACPAGMNGTPEQCWAKSQLLSLASSNPSLIQQGGTGQYLAIRPANRQTVYSIGWSPKYGTANAKTRLLKTDYLFAPYRPVAALLTSGSLDMSGSVFVDAPTGSPASVHSNGDVSSRSSDSIAGPVTATGSYDGNARVTNDADGLTGSGAPLQTIPRIDPRATYQQIAADPAYTSNWYDLCPDGSVHAPDTTTFLPCTGTLLSAAGAYRGWDFTAGSGSTPPVWGMSTRDSPYYGVYYVYQADANIGFNGGNSSQPWNATVIAEAAPTGGLPESCGKLGGNINWKLYDIQAFVSGLVLEAGADLNDSANNRAGAGLFAAADQVHFQTSSATLTGAVIAGDACTGSPADSNNVQGVTLHFDDTGEAPISSIVNTTLWLEYVG